MILSPTKGYRDLKKIKHFYGSFLSHLLNLLWHGCVHILLTFKSRFFLLQLQICLLTPSLTLMLNQQINVSEILFHVSSSPGSQCFHGLFLKLCTPEHLYMVPIVVALDKKIKYLLSPLLSILDYGSYSRIFFFMITLNPFLICFTAIISITFPLFLVSIPRKMEDPVNLCYFFLRVNLMTVTHLKVELLEVGDNA